MDKKDLKRINEIRERAENATKGKWKVERFYKEEPYEEFIDKAFVVSGTSVITANDWSNPCIRDLEFIANAREDIPYLLSLLNGIYQAGFDEGANSAATDILDSI